MIEISDVQMPGVVPVIGLLGQQFDLSAVDQPQSGSRDDDADRSRPPPRTAAESPLPMGRAVTEPAYIMNEAAIAAMAMAAVAVDVGSMPLPSGGSAQREQHAAAHEEGEQRHHGQMQSEPGRPSSSLEVRDAIAATADKRAPRPPRRR